MRRICGSYVYWYNRRYDRVGNLFQGRFKSEPVENDAYFLTVLRYIHQNAVKAGLANVNEQYKWSSYKEYINRAKLVDVAFTLSIFSKVEEKGIKGFIQYLNELNSDICMDNEENRRITDEEARDIIKEACKVKNATDLQKLDVSVRNICLRGLKKKYGLSIRQMRD